MFFFFIGGVQKQLRQVLKSEAGRYMSCGSLADLVDYDNVLKAFFVPVWRWPGKGPLLHCDNCNLFFPQSASLPPPQSPPSAAVSDVMRCYSCSRAVSSEDRFCPFCGVQL